MNSENKFGNLEIVQVANYSPYPVVEYLLHIDQVPWHNDTTMVYELVIGTMLTSTTRGTLEGEFIRLPFIELDRNLNEGDAFFRADLLTRHDTRIKCNDTTREHSSIQHKTFYVKCNPHATYRHIETTSKQYVAYVYLPETGNHLHRWTIRHGMITVHVALIISMMIVPGGRKSPLHLAERPIRMARPGDYISLRMSKRAFDYASQFAQSKFIVMHRHPEMQNLYICCHHRQFSRCRAWIMTPPHDELDDAAHECYVATDEEYSWIVHSSAAKFYCRALEHTRVPVAEDDMVHVLHVHGDEPLHCILRYPSLTAPIF